MMSLNGKYGAAGVLALVLALPASSYGQEPPRASQAQGQAQTQGQGTGQRGLARAGQRAGLPPVGPNMNQQQLQAWLDAFALVQAEKELQLTGEQYANFVAKLTRLHNVRRRTVMERRRVLNELAGLLQSSANARDEVIEEKLRTLEEVTRRGGEDLRRSYQEVDAVLTPWQRGRFRLFEETLERRKIDLLTKVHRSGS